MPFYRRTDDILETATVSVSAPTYQLSEEEHADHTYPVDGWYWYPSLDSALDGLPRSSATQSVLAWQARYLLATMPAVTAGPLASVPGENLLDQIDAFAGQALVAPDLEKFRGATTWQRTDPMLVQLSALAGMDAAAIDAWFEAAAHIA